MDQLCSNYIINHLPTLYGGKQDDFQRTSASLVSIVVDMIKTGAHFREILEFLRSERSTLAYKHETPLKEKFGIARSGPLAPQVGEQFLGNSGTPLDFPFESYNLSLLSQLRAHISLRTKISYVEEIFLGRQFVYEIRLLDKRDFKQIKLCPSYDVDCSYNEARKLKKLNPEGYARLALKIQLAAIRVWYPPEIEENKATLILVGTLSAEIDKMLVPLGQHITWLNDTPGEDPFERMLKYSKCTVVHQDIFSIDETLEEIELLFRDCITWTPASPLQTLKERIALLRFYLAYCMPHFRGDGAIGDWIELAIYHYHGFTRTRHRKDASPAHAPLSSILPTEYFKSLDTTIIIE